MVPYARVKAKIFDETGSVWSTKGKSSVKMIIVKVSHHLVH